MIICPECKKEFEDLKKYGGHYSSHFRGDNAGGVSRDHILSINYGFMNNIDPIIMSHPANCKIVTQSANSRKNKKSNIVLGELLTKIEEFNKRYPDYNLQSTTD